MNAELRDRMAELFAASRQVEAVCAEKEALELENADLRAELQKIREEKKDGLPLKNPEKVDFYKALLKERRKQLEEAVEESARLRRIVDEASGKASGSEPEEKGTVEEMKKKLLEAESKIQHQEEALLMVAEKAEESEEMVRGLEAEKEFVVEELNLSLRRNRDLQKDVAKFVDQLATVEAKLQRTRILMHFEVSRHEAKNEALLEEKSSIEEALQKESDEIGQERIKTEKRETELKQRLLATYMCIIFALLLFYLI